MRFSFTIRIVSSGLSKLKLRVSDLDIVEGHWLHSLVIEYRTHQSRGPGSISGGVTFLYSREETLLTRAAAEL